VPVFPGQLPSAVRASRRTKRRMRWEFTAKAFRRPGLAHWSGELRYGEEARADGGIIRRRLKGNAGCVSKCSSDAWPSASGAPWAQARDHREATNVSRGAVSQLLHALTWRPRKTEKELLLIAKRKSVRFNG